MSNSEASRPDKDIPRFWEALGIPKPKKLPDELAPGVNRELLLRLVRKELSETEARSVQFLIVYFAPWAEAHLEILIEEYERTRDESPGASPTPHEP